jgi:hypothetical protein
MIVLGLALVALLTCVIFSVALVWGSLESGVFVLVLCLLQSIEDRFDVYSDKSHQLHPS